MDQKRARITRLICSPIMEKKMGKYLVLGSNSFSGSNFCAWLLKHEHQVYATSRSNEAAYEFLPYRWQNAKPANFTFAKIDLNHDLVISKKNSPLVSATIHSKFCGSINGCPELATSSTLGASMPCRNESTDA